MNLKNWIKELCEGDENAWGEFVDRFHKIITGASRQFLSNDDAREVCSEFYELLVRDNYKILRRFKSSDNSLLAFRIYIKNIVVNVSRNYRKKQRIEYAELIEIADNRQNLLETTIENEEIKQLYKFIGKLPLVYRDVLQLYLMNYKPPQIAKILNVSIFTVHTRLRRAKEKLKKFYIIEQVSPPKDIQIVRV